MESTTLLKKGGEQAFKKTFEAYHHRLYFFLKKYGCDDYVAEEVLQETFIKLYKSIPTLKEDFKFSTQLFQIAKTTYIDYLRKRKLQTIPLNEEAMALPATINTEEKTETDVSKKLAIAIDGLPVKCKKIFLLSREDGLSYQEIATKLFLSPKTIENQIGKALKILRHKIKLALF